MSLASGQATTVNAGDDVIFTIDVTNQGTLDAYNIEVTDRIPAGMSLSVNDANGWVASGTDATNNSITFLAAGETKSIDIVLTVDASFQGTQLNNIAEITAADDDTDPTNTPPTDVDSTPDNNVPSEDDQDDEPVNVGQVFDLALVKSLAKWSACYSNSRR